VALKKACVDGHGARADFRPNPEQDMLTVLLIVLLVLALAGGGWGYSRYGAVGWSPAGIILLILFVLLLTGRWH
jgi:hypothetical protein